MAHILFILWIIKIVNLNIDTSYAVKRYMPLFMYILQPSKGSSHYYQLIF
jgi:hypothetical protein